MNTPSDQKIDKDKIESSDSVLVSIEDRQKLVGAFAWLIQEDKKQNPELYLQDCSKGLSNVQSK